jgi:glucose dehydrogenase
LDANTGKRIWHFQMVHHDLWDYDLPTAPKLLTVRNNGRNVDVVAQPTKHGFLFVFNRQTGAPLWRVEERPGAPIRCSRRIHVTDAAVPHTASAFRSTIVHGERHQSAPNSGATRSRSQAIAGIAQ